MGHCARAACIARLVPGSIVIETKIDYYYYHKTYCFERVTHAGRDIYTSVIIVVRYIIIILICTLRHVVLLRFLFCFVHLSHTLFIRLSIDYYRTTYSKLL